MRPAAPATTGCPASDARMAASGSKAPLKKLVGKDGSSAIAPLANKVAVLGPNGMDPWKRISYIDANAQWIWDLTGAQSWDFPEVKRPIRFQKQFTVPADGDYAVALAVDNVGVVYMDGDKVDSIDGGWPNNPTAGTTNDSYITFTWQGLKAGTTHVFEVVAQNLGDGPNPAGLLASAKPITRYETEDGKPATADMDASIAIVAEDSAPMFLSDASWTWAYEA